MIRVTRIESFSSAHRLHSPHLSVEENLEVYGKCNWEGGHGHNYTVEVTVEGEIDERTGMFINLADLKSLIWQHVLCKLDHKNIDRDVEYFRERPSTAENVARYIWIELAPHIPLTAHLYEIKLHETSNNYVTFRGEFQL